MGVTGCFALLRRARNDGASNLLRLGVEEN